MGSAEEGMVQGAEKIAPMIDSSEYLGNKMLPHTAQKVNMYIPNGLLGLHRGLANRLLKVHLSLTNSI